MKKLQIDTDDIIHLLAAKGPATKPLVAYIYSSNVIAVSNETVYIHETKITKTQLLSTQSLYTYRTVKLYNRL